VLNLVESVLRRFGFKQFDIMLSTRPAQSVGSDAIWEKATAALVGALNRKKWEFSVDEGGGAFYGPKIDLKIQDAIGRKWQCSTVQCDFNLPERFDLEYAPGTSASAGEVEAGQKTRPIMVHRAIFGSIERFFGVLLENSAGDFPLWLAPIQLRLLPVVDEVRPYCEQVAAQAARLGLRVEVDRTGNRLAKLVRSAEQDKVPLSAVVGLRERDGGLLSLRARKRGELASGLGLETSMVLELLQQAAKAQGEDGQVRDGEKGLEEFVREFTAAATATAAPPLQ
jgi:threonyl-tRNA synthetase